ncbi:MAG: hypothetical protein IT318_00910, partial [Anaerolineales bacterium]|nr:hypothetical protein [Anaerolineales bacterium]
QAFNRYSLVYNNPTRYTDPTGHMPSDRCDSGECEVYDPQLNRLRQDWLFSKIFLGSGESGEWTTDDWNFYFNHRDELWAHPDRWINADGSGWEGFAVHAERLGSLYGPTGKEQFIREFGLMFAGLNYELSWYESAIEAAGGPELPFLSEGNTGLASKYKDSLTPGDNQSHHYAAMFFLSYFVDPEAAMIVNYARDPDNPGDVNLGNRAATQAYAFRFYSSGPTVIGGQIEALRVSDDKRRHSR